MEKIPWYQSAIVRQQIVMIIVGLLGVFKLATDIDVDATVTAVFAGIAAIVPVWTLVTRLFKANPPLTDTAARKEDEKQEQLKVAKSQGGFASPLMLVTLVVIAGLLAATVSGCTGTTAAYRAAEGVDQQAYVALEHYSALQKEAIALKAKGTASPEVIDAIKKADAAAFPVVQRVKQLRDVYKNIKNADNQEALQSAVNDLVLLLSDLVTAIKAGRSS